ncbi:hypothetical protein H2200_011982 [Cladophialophora chaetospira]|uniref:Heterokaryon incompatibility domain-containing protein n=1 Tax=Cladophialophora chaetospira TaxID=386627 RepID=A0AA38WZ37_9EURO|nr:hypothetical protein H2200_011982 [Cladophialophora chaetospira]
MDHIPHCGPHTIRVPYLGGEDWDGGDFLGYLERRRFYHNISHSGWRGEKILQVMQTWLFFGIFTEVMRLAEIDFRQEAFIKQDDQGRYITTKALTTYSHALARYEEGQEPSGKARRLAIIASYLEKAYQQVNFISTVLSHTTDKTFAQSTGGPVMLSIGLTSYWLAKSCAAIYRDVGGAELRGYTHASASFLEAKMLTEGWCPSVTERLESLGNKELQYVGYTYGSPDGERLDHSKCSAGVCARSQIDEATYQVRHTTKGCGCPLLEVPLSKMENIIQTGGTPVCRLMDARASPSTVPTETEPDDPKSSRASIVDHNHPGGRAIDFRLEVGRASPDSPYLAISHVWTDGLGNPINNGLPLCELVQLQCRVSGASPENQKVPTSNLPSFDSLWSKWFWMDTLCVPVHPESKHLRKQAITKMRQIYADAEGVLVLDSGLLRHREAEDHVRMMIRILLSSWCSRLWTMQESLLAKKVMIVFGPQANSGENTMVVLDDWVKVFESEAQHERLSGGSTVVSSCHALYQSLRNTNLLNMHNPTAHILRAVPHRAVTKRADETICISTLLGLDVVKLLDQPFSGNDISDEELADQRMITLLQMIQVVPFSLLFAFGPRLVQPGFRWALKSFLHQSGSDPAFHDSPTVKVTSVGVECTCYGILLKSDVAQCKDFMVYDDGGPDIPIAVASHPANHDFEVPIPATPPGAERQLALVLALDVSLGGPAILAEIVDPPTTASGGTDGSSETKAVRFLKLMGISRLPADPQVIKVMTAKAGSVTSGVALGPQQKWLIT